MLLSVTTFAPGFQVTFGSRQQVTDAIAAINHARGPYMQALATRNAQLLGQLDVFYECTTSGQWAHAGQPKAEPLAPEVPKGAVVGRWIGALVIGVAVAGISYAVASSNFEDSKTPQRPATTPRR